VRAVDIPDWFVWIALGLAVLQALALVPVIRRLRGPDHAVRSKARLDLLESVGNMLLLSGLTLGLVVAESWFWLTMTAVYAVKGVHLLRARRRPTG
jgi:hypothetical protein